MAATARKRVPACALHAAINAADEALGTALSHVNEVYEAVFLAAQIGQRRIREMEAARTLLARIEGEPERAMELGRAARVHLAEAIMLGDKARWIAGYGVRHHALKARSALKTGLASVAPEVGRCRCKGVA